MLIELYYILNTKKLIISKLVYIINKNYKLVSKLI